MLKRESSSKTLILVFLAATTLTCGTSSSTKETETAEHTARAICRQVAKLSAQELRWIERIAKDFSEIEKSQPTYANSVSHFRRACDHAIQDLSSLSVVAEAASHLVPPNSPTQELSIELEQLAINNTVHCNAIHRLDGASPVNRDTARELQEKAKQLRKRFELLERSAR